MLWKPIRQLEPGLWTSSPARGCLIVKRLLLDMAVSREVTGTFPLTPVHTHHNVYSMYLLYFFVTSNAVERIKVKHFLPRLMH